MTDDARYISSAEGATLLGVNRSNFFYLVNAHGVRKLAGKGQRDTGYHEGDLLAIKHLREQHALYKPRPPRRKKPAPVLLDWLSPEDIPAILRLDQLVYHELFLAEAAVYRSWSEKNPQLAMAAFDARSHRQEMLAYVAALPVAESVILAVLRGERDETSITMEEIQDYTRPGGYTLLANSAVAHPDRPDLLYKVLYRMMAEWIERYPERYITRIYAQSISERGDQLVQHFFMAPRYDLAPNAYMLDLARPGASKIVRWFQGCLLQKAPMPADLRQPFDFSASAPLPVEFHFSE
jgi:hypothetical protein